MTGLTEITNTARLRKTRFLFLAVTLILFLGCSSAVRSPEQTEVDLPDSSRLSDSTGTSIQSVGTLSDTGSIATVHQDYAVQLQDTLVTSDSSRVISADENLAVTDSDSLAFPDSLVDISLLADSLFTDSLLTDFLLTDSLLVDSLTEEEEESSDIDTTISYQAESIRFDVNTRVSVLMGNAKIEYKNMTLTAHTIEVDWENQLMTATGTIDTVWTDSTHTEIDSLIEEGSPVFNESQQRMTGEMMRVNMETREGYVVGGRSEYGDGFYYGRDIQKVSENVAYIETGSFTTCDHEHPHYRFTSTQMKMIYRDKVFAKPVVLRFGDVPVAALPFAVFPTRSGRRSGLIIPTYGDNDSQGRHLRNLGYYWAASEYWDALASLDFYERLGFLVRGDIKYKIRYKLNGGISGSYNNRSASTGSSSRTEGWDLRVVHNQDITDHTRLRVNASFVSRGDYYSDVSNNASVRLDQKMRSNATFSHSWPGTRHSVSMNLSHVQDLRTDENNSTLPSFNYRIGSGPLFPSRSERHRSDPNLIYEAPLSRDSLRVLQELDEEEERWYNRITWSYSNRFDNTRDESLETDPDTNEDYMNETWRSGMQHSMSLNFSSPVFRHFTVSPSFSYREDWLLERRVWQLNDDSEPVSSQERGFFQRRTFNTGFNVQTRFYGYFNINRWSVQTIRHVVTPTAGFSYRPDFSDSEWGYYQRLTRAESAEPSESSTALEPGESVLRDRYAGGIFGGTSAGKQMQVNFSLGNLFQMKRVKINENGEEEEEKTDLFTYNLNTSYNFAADSLRWGDLRGSFRAEPIKSSNRLGLLERLSIDLSTTHSFYQYDPDAGRVDRLYWDEGNHGLNFLRLTNFSTTSSFTLSGPSPFVQFGQREPGRRTRSTAEADTLDMDEDGLPDVDYELDERFFDPIQQSRRGLSRSSSPWRITGSLRYNMIMTNPMQPRETIRLSSSASVNLTQNWHVTYTTLFDLMDKEVTSSSFIITRDLHCWEASLNWSPQGIGQGFYLHIGLKSPQLQDLKLERRRGRGTVGYNFY